ncbi:MAG: ABC transporter permease [Sideroxydans sp.]|nr:ABC transporter permease [Sideroxydans sp.]
MTTQVISPLSKALNDIASGFGGHKIWTMLGWQDIKQRYRRSALGPWWLTISTGVMVAGMGPLYGRLFGQPTAGYVAFVAASLIAWQLINAIINDSCQVFIAAEGHIKQTRLPLSIYVYRVIWRNMIIFIHNLAILLIVYILMPFEVSVSTLLAVAGLLLLLINSVWIGLMLGMLCARFRDIPQIIASLLQIAFFLTPIFWKPEMLGRHQWIAQINPLFHLVEIIRNPLLGKSASLLSWGVVSGVAVIGSIATLSLFSRFRARIAYWL